MVLGPVIPPVDPITFGIDIVVSIIGALFGGLFGGGDVAALQNGLNQLRTATAQITDWLKRFAWTIATALGALLQAIKTLFEDLLDKMKTLLQKIAKALEWVIKHGIPDLLKIIRQLRQWLAMVYQKYIRPVLIYLQYVRRVLFILELLHVKFAAKLDAWLGQIQNVLLTPFFYLARSVNGIATWVNLIVTAGGLIQRGVFINSHYAYQSDWIGMWWNGQMPGGVPGAALVPPAAYTPETSQDVAAGVGLAVASGAGEYADYGALTLQAFDDANAGFIA